MEKVIKIYDKDNVSMLGVVPLDEIGGGGNSGGIKATTYANLKSMRDSGTLTAGAWYRITDYVTTTTQEDTQSAGNLFDVIVRADNENTLNENAFACVHNGDTYFTESGANLAAWELKYDIDNDTTKYAWADPNNGKGVIWWMKDEWDNECPYDFKNIMFARHSITASTKVPDLVGLYAHKSHGSDITTDNDTTYMCYTFCMLDKDNDETWDVSTYQDKYLSDEGFCYRNHDNHIKAFLNSVQQDDDTQIQMSVLPDIVFVTDTNICAIEENYGEFYGFYSNTFGNGCYYNTFGNDCSYNTFGNDCGYNTFGNNCGYNTFGNNCGYNTFGNGCYYNTFGNNCGYNTFGNGCRSNTFGNDCGTNTFGNDCGSNTFGNDCGSNTFGNGCRSNTFGNDCRSNTFGNASGAKSYYRLIIFENGNQYIRLNANATTSSAQYVQNVKVTLGVNNTTTYKTIDVQVNEAFQQQVVNANNTNITA